MTIVLTGDIDIRDDIIIEYFQFVTVYRVRWYFRSMESYKIKGIWNLFSLLFAVETFNSFGSFASGFFKAYSKYNALTPFLKHWS